MEEEYLGTEMWIKVVLKELKQATTEEIIERVKIYNQECADRIPLALAQMRVSGEVHFQILPTQDGTRKKMVWMLF